MNKIQNFLWILVLIAGVLLTINSFVVSRQIETDHAKDTSSHVNDEEVMRPVYALTSHHNKQITNENFVGTWQLVFFGFTYCPEICPLTMSKITSVMNRLGGLADTVQPIFITVDPQRDTSEVISKYLEPHHPKILGLTGTDEQIKLTADSFKVYYSKIDNPHDPDHYMVNHSSYIYLIDPQGIIQEFFAYDENTDLLVKDITKLLKPLG